MASSVEPLSHYSAVATRVGPQLPPGAWDSHVHVVDEERYPFHPDYPFRPKKASLDDLLRFEASLGISHVCLVNISSYKTDNKLLLESLRRLGGSGRGVVCIDPETISNDELDEMHRVGVRGARLNMKTERKNPDRERFKAILHSYGHRLRRLRWALQIYISMAQFRLIADEIPKLGGRDGSVPVVIDHLGHPDPAIPVTQQEGYAELMGALRRREIWIKLSGTYRFSAMPSLDAFAREVIRAAPTQVVWASDWPHTGSVENNPNGDRTIHQDYRRVDDVKFVKQCIEWCDRDEDLMRQIWVNNPRRLWQYDETKEVHTKQKE